MVAGGGEEERKKKIIHLDRLLDGRVRVNTVLVVEIDAVRPQTLQAGRAGLLDVLGPAVHLHLAVHKPVGELGRQEDLIAAAGLLEPPADQFLVRIGAVDIGRVPEGNAHIRSPCQDLERLFIVLTAKGGIGKGHSHAAETLGGDEIIADFALGVFGSHLSFWYRVLIFGVVERVSRSGTMLEDLETEMLSPLSDIYGLVPRYLL